MVEAINPINESTPFCLIISIATTNEALPDIGLNKANGIISLGNFKYFSMGKSTIVIKSIIPELLNNSIAKNNPINVEKF